MDTLEVALQASILDWHLYILRLTLTQDLPHL